MFMSTEHEFKGLLDSLERYRQNVSNSSPQSADRGVMCSNIRRLMDTCYFLVEAYTARHDTNLHEALHFIGYLHERNAEAVKQLAKVVEAHTPPLLSKGKRGNRG